MKPHKQEVNTESHFLISPGCINSGFYHMTQLLYFYNIPVATQVFLA